MEMCKIKICLEEQKQIQLAILSDIADFCEKNSLYYFLAYGTLIGAVRHQGYIPWDDDIDIWMPEPDYDRFLETYKAENPNYKVIHIGNKKEYSLTFAKVHDESTRFQELYSRTNDFGIFVDIFPLHGYRDYNQWRKCNMALRLIRIKNAVWYNEKALYKNIANFLGKFFLYMIPISLIIHYAERIVREVKYENAQLLSSFMESSKPYPKRWFSDYKYSFFEGRLFRIPLNYHDILETLYGDYMQLPPEEERIAKHHAKVWRKE